MTTCPQHMINVPTSSAVQPKALVAAEAVQAAVAAATQQLAGRGRVVLRPSGTEPVIRVMVEGESPEQVAELASMVAEAVAQAGAVSVVGG